MCRGQLMGWFDADGIPNGRGGITAVDEPSVAVCSDGRLMMMARSTVGRLVQTYSEDGGETWTPVLPSDLAGFVFSAAAEADTQYRRPVVRVEPDVAGGDLEGVSTGPLVCGDFNGLRGELVAFQDDRGQRGMEDVDRVPSQYPVSPVIALPELGSLPEDFATFDYATCLVSRRSRSADVSSKLG